MGIRRYHLLLGVFLCNCFILGTHGIYVDKGVPYNKGQLHVGELTITETGDHSPLHVKAYFPVEVGSYPVIYFIPGLNGLVPGEMYGIVLYKVAAHGFVVFGIDAAFPGIQESNEVSLRKPEKVNDSIDKYFQQYFWKFMVNKTVSTILWNKTGLMCHSSGCDDTVRMIKANGSLFQSSAFLEPVSANSGGKIDFKIPALMYGTELSEQGLLKCVIPGMDYNTFYNNWSCPRIVMNVANFGHCDILDPFAWQACHDINFCRTANETLIPEYRMFVQGVISAFFVTTLQGGTDYGYLTNKTNIPLQLLELKSDINCTQL